VARGEGGRRKKVATRNYRGAGNSENPDRREFSPKRVSFGKFLRPDPPFSIAFFLPTIFCPPPPRIEMTTRHFLPRFRTRRAN